MEEVHNHKKNMENLLTSITKFFGLDNDLVSLSKLNRFFDEEDYKNLIVLSYDCLDLKSFGKYLSGDSFLIQHNFFNITVPKSSNDDAMHSDLLDRINGVAGCKAYSVFPFGRGAYDSLEEAFKRIVNLSLGSDKKLIYASFRGHYKADEDGINKINDDCAFLCGRLDNSVILILSESAKKDMKVPLCVVKRMSSSERVRLVQSKDLQIVNHFMTELCKERVKVREDIFDSMIPYTPYQFSSYCSRLDTKTCLVYEISEEVVGFITFEIYFIKDQPNLKDRSYLFIENIYVKEGYRRRGIGTKLYREACQYAGKLRVKRIEFDVYYFEKDMMSFLNSFHCRSLKQSYEVDLLDVN